jgi:hypothetical protein
MLAGRAAAPYLFERRSATVNPIARTLIAGCAAAAALLPLRATAAPANTLRELSAELGACALGRGVEPGSELTISFMLNRWGAVIGKPRITHARLPEDPDARRRILESVAKAIDLCLPLPITDGLGGAIAGRPIAIRLAGPKKGTET